MRVLALHTHSAAVWASFYRDLAHYGVMVDVVNGALSRDKILALACKRDLPVLFCTGTDAPNIVRLACDRRWPVVVLCANLADWWAVSFDGLARFVDLYVFANQALANDVNRNVHHVVVAGPGDAGVLRAMLHNLVRHYKGRTDALDVRETARRKAGAVTVQACRDAHGDVPSFLELCLFLDATHADRERSVAVRELPQVLHDAALLPRKLRSVRASTTSAERPRLEGVAQPSAKRRD